MVLLLLPWMAGSAQAQVVAQLVEEVEVTEQDGDVAVTVLFGCGCGM